MSNKVIFAIKKEDNGYSFISSLYQFSEYNKLIGDKEEVIDYMQKLKSIFSEQYFMDISFEVVF